MRAGGLAENNRAATEELGHFDILGNQKSSQGAIELTCARFTAYAALEIENELKIPLREGGYGFVRIREADSQRLGQWIWQELRKWVEDKWERARSA